jgi:hemolysin activation/secretion protein
MVHPAVAFALGPRSDIAIGPIFKSSSTDNVPGSYLSETNPYGSGDFGQAGLRLGIYKDNRIRAKDAYRGLLLDLTATAYPKMADVTSSFQVLAAITAAYFTLPMITHPVFVLKAGAKQVFGDYPFHEAAFIGGEPSGRDLPHERFAGDAAIYGSAELRIPVVDFAFILPIDIGVYGYGDTGRVFVDRESPDGWHNSRGAGVWMGILNPFTGVSVDFGNYIGRNIVQAKIGFTF